MKMTIADQFSAKRKLLINRYSNGQLSVSIQEDNGEPIAELSIMNNSIALAPNEFILKDYSENEYVVQQYYDAEVIIPTGRFVLIGSHLCPICQIESEF